MYTGTFLKYLAEIKLQKQSKLKVLTNPELKEAAAAIKKALGQRRTIIVAGECKVLYSGRAKSTLESGERILIIKEDGSLLVHRPVGYEPVNWQPSGSTPSRFTQSDKNLVKTCVCYSTKFLWFQLYVSMTQESFRFMRVRRKCTRQFFGSLRSWRKASNL